jgi:hypothetical protein
VDYYRFLHHRGHRRFLLAHQQASPVVYQCTFASARLRPEPALISVSYRFAQKREQRCRSFYFAAYAPAYYNLIIDIVRLLLMVPIYSWISLASYIFWVRSLSFRVFTSAHRPDSRNKFRITPRPCCSSGTHTRPSSSPLSSISCSRICLRTPKCRRPSFANAVCRGKPTRNADGVGSPERSGYFLSDLSGGNHRWGKDSVYLSLCSC